MRALAYTGACAALLAMAQAKGQTPYPDLTIQDVTWTEGTHHYGVTQKILSPFTADHPVSIGGTADAEFVSGTQVRLRPGFHAGGFSTEAAKFRAYINESLGPVGDAIIISPAPDGSEPYGSIVDNVIHVHKWEKVEVGLRLPQEYQDAIDRFFRHYYPYNFPPYPPDNPNTNVAVPGNVDPAHDLNPYADDSLQLVMTLTKPDGAQTMKWGFFMKEGKWESDDPDAKLTEDPDHPLYPYHVRFRFAPDQVGPWQFRISVKAPHTSTLGNTPLPDLLYTGHALACEPPLPDNKGPLIVNPNNRRTLWFAESQEPFFGMGVNMADARRQLSNYPQGTHWAGYYLRDHEEMELTMDQLREVGGNFLRMYLMRNMFAPEWVNLGVYDAYKTPEVCDVNFLPGCDNGGWSTQYASNCQFQCWAFDRMLDRARANDLGIQLCIDPYPPIVDYEKYIWGAHPYHLHFLEPERQTVGNPIDLKRFFFTPGEQLGVPENVFYWWKRKYKYIMSRWGWSVNLPIIEPFNEIDQLLSYSSRNMLPNPSIPCQDWNDEPDWATCLENRVNWTADPNLPGTVSDWFTHIAQFVRGAQDPNDPVHSPLGEDKKLFLASFTDAKAANVEEWNPNSPPNLPHYQVFTNPEVDLIDVHKAAWLTESTSAQVAGRFMRDAAEHAERFWNTFPAPNAQLGQRKPFNQGEHQHYTEFEYNGQKHEIISYFHNYDIAFHAELWSSAFSGKFAAGTTWNWSRVFWWPDALGHPPIDDNNEIDSWPTGPEQFTNVLGQPNYLLVNGAYIPVENKRTHHHFKPLADLLNHPSWLAYDFFGQDYRVRRNEDFSGLDVYYLQNKVPPYDLANLAIGWVQNRNASLYNNYYLHSGRQRFFECTPPAAGEGSTTWLTGFEPGTYHVSWFPTRLNSTVHPPDGEVTTSISGAIELDLTGHFGGIFNNFLDTLRSDYAFIITPQPFVKSLLQADEPEDPPIGTSWDFLIHPNPTRGEFTLRFPDDGTKDIAIMDLAGRLVARFANVPGGVLQFPHLRLSQGAYWVRASDGQRAKAKQLIIY